MLAVLPSCLVFKVDRLCCVLERRNDHLLLLPFGKRIQPTPRLLANLPCSGTGIGKSNMLQRSQSDIVALAALLHPDRPMAPAGTFQIENKPITIGIASGFLEVLDFQRAKVSHCSGSKSPHT